MVGADTVSAPLRFLPIRFFYLSLCPSPSCSMFLLPKPMPVTSEDFPQATGITLPTWKCLGV